MKVEFAILPGRAARNRIPAAVSLPQLDFGEIPDLLHELSLFSVQQFAREILNHLKITANLAIRSSSQ